MAAASPQRGRQDVDVDGAIGDGVDRDVKGESVERREIAPAVADESRHGLREVARRLTTVDDRHVMAAFTRPRRHPSRQMTFRRR